MEMQNLSGWRLRRVEMCSKCLQNGLRILLIKLNEKVESWRGKFEGRAFKLKKRFRVDNFQMCIICINKSSRVFELALVMKC